MPKLPQYAILTQAAQELGLLDDKITDTYSGQRGTEARYIVFALMEKDGYTHAEISKFFKVTRESVTKGLAKLDDWKRLYKQVKGNYERCERKILCTATL